MRNITAVILGGGRGARLMPLTRERAKPAVGFAGKYRLIDIPLSNCINSGITRVYVLTQFLSASLHRHIMQTYQFDIFRNGFVDILAAEQTQQREDWFQGTADAVRATMNHLAYYRSEQVLILAGDQLYRMDYGKLLNYHRQNKADITIGVYPVTSEESTRMGLVKVNDRAQIEKIAEKPKDPNIIHQFKVTGKWIPDRSSGNPSRHFLASMGIYVFEPEILVNLLNDPDKIDFGGELIPAAIDKYNVIAYPYHGYWRDIGTIASYFDANISLAQPNPPFSLYEPGWPFYTHSRSLPPSRLIGSQIRDSLVVEGSNIMNANICDSIVGVRSTVREGSHLNEVVMLGADYYEHEQVLGSINKPRGKLPGLGIGKSCRIERTIIDKNVRIGDDVTITPKPDVIEETKELYWIRDGITIIPKGVVIPAGTRL